MTHQSVLELSQKRNQERLSKITEIKARIESYTLMQGFELSPENLENVASLTFRRESLVHMMSKTTLFTPAYEEISKEIVECEVEIAHIDDRLI